jgi:hypothetical protein
MLEESGWGLHPAGPNHEASTIQFNSCNGAGIIALSAINTKVNS